jgi:hypothetical protein
MKNSKCSKFFPKGTQPNTIVGEDGFVQYRRRPDTGHFVKRYGVKLIMNGLSHTIDIVKKI